MKKIILLVVAFSITSFAFAKKIKFSVDMTGKTVSPNGVHVQGNFQILAGYADDWAPDLTPLTKEGSTEIYSITLDLPAFRAYRYQFVNGDLSYEAEFVPYFSRFVDPDVQNRWLFLDSLDNGVTDIGAVLYEGNAPAGKFLFRFKVDMTKQLPIDTVNSRPHVEGSFQGWSTTATAMYAPKGAVYEYIAFVNAGSYQFKYINGKTVNKEETVPTACATSNNRTMTITQDTVLKVVCFGSCSACSPNGIFEQQGYEQLTVYPNPSNDFTVLKFNDGDLNHTVQIKDVTGKTVRLYDNFNKAELRIEKEELNAGIYFITSLDSKKSAAVTKWIVQ